MSARSLTTRLRDHVSTIVVTTVSALFGVVLVEATGVLATAIGSDAALEQSNTVRIVLGAVTSVFILIAVYVGAIVTANTFSTIIAGRVRQIALLRLLGAQSRRLRRSIAAEGLIVGLLGSLLGLVLGVAVTAGTVAIGVAGRWLPEAPYSFLDPATLLPVLIVALTTWAAAWVGSRRVTVVTPLAATGAAVEQAHERAPRRPVRTAFALVLGVLGVGLMALGVVVGLLSPLGLVIAFFGGVFSFTGLIVGAHAVMPPVLRLAGRALGQRPPARLAAENAVRFPERSARATIGLVIGVTLVTMFAVAMESYRSTILANFDGSPAARAAVDQSLTATTAIFGALVGVSAIIAAIGMVNNLSLSVLQRTRELGLLRALGFTGGQVRRMIVAESAQMSLASVVFGIVLGVLYGWVAAQSLLGSITHGIGAPTLPWLFLAVLVACGAVLAIAASVAPARRATTISPVLALAIE
ncbi:FtsX-like permease family protein [Rathayibacter sp. YIM 133350]|uniref:ABC transporter permease n=1 Tax=Rathayibacter sp. YIM 133350 TaxID=3131992 RepID=UPI00307F9D52